MNALQVAKGLAKVEERIDSLNQISKFVKETGKDRPGLRTEALDEIIKELDEKRTQLEAKLTAVEIK